MLGFGMAAVGGVFPTPVVVAVHGVFPTVVCVGGEVSSLVVASPVWLCVNDGVVLGGWRLGSDLFWLGGVVDLARPREQGRNGDGVDRVALGETVLPGADPDKPIRILPQRLVRGVGAARLLPVPGWKQAATVVAYERSRVWTWAWVRVWA